MRAVPVSCLASALALAAAFGCKGKGAEGSSDAGAGASPQALVQVDGGAPSGDTVPAAVLGGNATPELQPTGKPMIGVTSFVAPVYKEPRDNSKKLGYLRVGAKVARSEQPVAFGSCKGGWYQIYPKGYVCAGEDTTLDLDAPILKATKPPNMKAALPYKYAFVRAVLPMYVRVPTADEQIKAEFKLQEHLDWFKENGESASKVALGANDVAIDDRGVPVPGKKLGELGLGKASTEMSLGELFGGSSDGDAIPFWLEGNKRGVSNIADFKVTDVNFFGERARRHTGLAFIGSFATGPESLERRFGITTDLRLVPTSKMKPDEASPWHGLELGGEMTLPLAFVRAQNARSYHLKNGKVSPAEEVDHRAVFALSGTMKNVDGVKYVKMKDHRWLSMQDVGLAVAPATWPDDAEKGKKWIEISIGNQTLVMWEGKTPIYATLVSSGQAGIDDPKTTTATIRGVFRIRNKHVTATMDSNGRSSVGGGKPMSVASASSKDDDDDRPSKSSSKSHDKSKKGSKGAGAENEHEKNVPKKGDGEYGVTKRRGEGTFQLRDVPWIQYFENGYALHAAYWHDVFGTPRSHGCVNLAPVDAHRLFMWTDPPVPEGWHAVNAGDDMGEGTLVVIHE